MSAKWGEDNLHFLFGQLLHPGGLCKLLLGNLLKYPWRSRRRRGRLPRQANWKAGSCFQKGGGSVSQVSTQRTSLHCQGLGTLSWSSLPCAPRAAHTESSKKQNRT